MVSEENWFTYLPVTIAKYAPPKELDFAQPSDRPHWKSRFTQFGAATKLNTENPECQISTLLYAMGPTSDAVFDSELMFSDNVDKEDYTKVIKAFDSYFSPIENVFHKRTLFARMRQNPGETVASFSTRLHEVASKCKYDKPSEQIRDHIITHMSDSKCSKELQKKDFASLKLADVVQAAKAAEMLDDQMTTQQPADTIAAASSTSHRKGLFTMRTLRIPALCSDDSQCRQNAAQGSKKYAWTTTPGVIKSTSWSRNILFYDFLINILSFWW